MSLCCVESVRGPMVIRKVSKKGNETKANARVSYCFGMIVVSRRIKQGEQSYEGVQERRKLITFWNFVMF
jgi:hypothetical protein